MGGDDAAQRSPREDHEEMAALRVLHSVTFAGDSGPAGVEGEQQLPGRGSGSRSGRHASFVLRRGETGLRESSGSGFGGRQQDRSRSGKRHSFGLRRGDTGLRDSSGRIEITQGGSRKGRPASFGLRHGATMTSVLPGSYRAEKMPAPGPLGAVGVGPRRPSIGTRKRYEESLNRKRALLDSITSGGKFSLMSRAARSSVLSKVDTAEQSDMLQNKGQSAKNDDVFSKRIVENGGRLPFPTAKALADLLKCGASKPPWSRSDVEVGVLEMWLRQFAAFHALDEVPRKRLARALVLTIAQPGDFVFRVGDPSDSGMFIILTGTAEVYQDLGHGDLQLASTLTAGDAFGMGALGGTAGKRECSVLAKVDLALLQLTVGTFRWLLENPEADSIETLETIPERLGRPTSGKAMLGVLGRGSTFFASSMLHLATEQEESSGDGKNDGDGSGSKGADGISKASLEVMLENTEFVSQVLEKAPHERTAEDIDALFRLVQHTRAFQTLLKAEGRAMCRHLRLRELEDEDVIEASCANGVYVVLEGELVAMVRSVRVDGAANTTASAMGGGSGGGGNGGGGGGGGGDIAARGNNTGQKEGNDDALVHESADWYAEDEGNKSFEESEESEEEDVGGAATQSFSNAILSHGKYTSGRKTRGQGAANRWMTMKKKRDKQKALVVQLWQAPSSENGDEHDGLSSISALKSFRRRAVGTESFYSKFKRSAVAAVEARAAASWKVSEALLPAPACTLRAGCSFGEETITERHPTRHCCTEPITGDCALGSIGGSKGFSRAGSRSASRSESSAMPAGPDHNLPVQSAWRRVSFQAKGVARLLYLPLDAYSEELAKSPNQPFTRSVLTAQQPPEGGGIYEMGGANHSLRGMRMGQSGASRGSSRGIQQRRSSKNLSTFNLREILRTRPKERIQAQVDVMKALLEVLPFFVQLPNAVRRDICEHASLKTFKPGQVIVRQGELRADKFFVILCGSATVHVRGKKGCGDPALAAGRLQTSFGRCVRAMHVGSAFGEQAMLETGRGRSASVLAREDVCVLVVHYFDYARAFRVNIDFDRMLIRDQPASDPRVREILDKPGAARSEEEVELVSRWAEVLPFFKTMPKEGAEVFCKEAKLLKMRPGQLLFRQGDTAEHLYLILSGSFSVHRIECWKTRAANAVMRELEKRLHHEVARDRRRTQAMMGAGPPANGNCPPRATVMRRTKSMSSFEAAKKASGASSPVVPGLVQFRRRPRRRVSKTDDDASALLEELLAGNRKSREPDLQAQRIKRRQERRKRHITESNAIKEEEEEEGEEEEEEEEGSQGDIEEGTDSSSDEDAQDSDSEDSTLESVDEGGKKGKASAPMRKLCHATPRLRRNNIARPDPLAALNGGEVLRQYGPCKDVASVGGSLAELSVVASYKNKYSASRFRRRSTAIARSFGEVLVLPRAVLDQMIRENQGMISSEILRDLVSKPYSERTYEETALLEHMLMRISFVKQVSRDAHLLHKISKLIRFESVPSGTPVFVQGQEGDKLFIVLRGTVQIRKRARVTSNLSRMPRWTFARSGADNSVLWETALARHYGKLVVELSGGDSFGEMSLVSNAPRNGSAICIEPCEFLVLNKAAYDATLRSVNTALVFQPALAEKAATGETGAMGDGLFHASDKAQGFRSLVSSLPVFQELQLKAGVDALVEICHHLEYKSYPPRHRLARRGDMAEEVLIIIKGTVRQSLIDDIDGMRRPTQPSGAGRDGAGGSGTGNSGSAVAVAGAGGGAGAGSGTGSGRALEGDAVAAGDPSIGGDHGASRDAHETGGAAGGTHAAENILQRGDTLRESAIALGQPLSMFSYTLERTIAVSLKRSMYLRLWPESLRVGSKLSCLRNSFIFNHAHPKELLALTHLMSRETYRRGTPVPTDASLLVIYEGTCAVQAGRGPVIVDVGMNESFGEAHCLGRRRCEVDDAFHLVTKSNVILFRLSARRVAASVSSVTLSRISSIAATKRAWRLAFLSHQEAVNLGQQRGGLERSQLCLREELKRELKARLASRTAGDKRKRAEAVEIASVLPRRDPPRRLRGNVFEGESWMDVHLRDRAEDSTTQDERREQTRAIASKVPQPERAKLSSEARKVSRALDICSNGISAKADWRTKPPMLSARGRRLRAVMDH